jgi:predicted  nucleic acid-binding Zn-ribbon protein
MSQSNADFLEQFQRNLSSLTQIKTAIEKNIQDRKQFTNTIITRLSQINEKITSLTTKIKELKTLADQLKTQVDNNNSNIGQKQSQLDALNARIQQLEQEKQDLNQKLQQLQEKCASEIQSLQVQIDNREVQIQKLNAENDSLKQRIKALSDELKNTGDLGTKSAADLTSQAEQFKAEMDALINKNAQEIEQLKNIINQKDQQINQIQSELAQANEEKRKQTEIISQTQNQATSSSQTLQQQIDSLKAENADLISRLRTANEAILEAVQSLSVLSNEAVDQENNVNVERAFQAVEQSLMEINNAIQGNSSQSSQQGRMRSFPIPSDTKITVNQINGSPLTLTYDNILLQLRQKAAKIGPGRQNKYQVALDELKTVSNPNEVQGILSRNVDFQNNNIKGGKKSRKLKKQKGGFHYKLSSRRKSLATSVNFKNRSNKSNKSSK